MTDPQEEIAQLKEEIRKMFRSNSTLREKLEPIRMRMIEAQNLGAELLKEITELREVLARGGYFVAENETLASKIKTLLAEIWELKKEKDEKVH